MQRAQCRSLCGRSRTLAAEISDHNRWRPLHLPHLQEEGKSLKQTHWCYIFRTIYWQLFDSKATWKRFKKLLDNLVYDTIEIPNIITISTSGIASSKLGVDGLLLALIGRIICCFKL
jgi:hypothetical protein